MARLSLFVGALCCGVRSACADELKVGDGVVVKFGPEGGLTILDGLVVEGQAAFTSANDDTRGGAISATPGVPAPGDWRGLRFERSAAAARVEFGGLYVLYAGREGPACTLRRTSIPFSRLFVSDSADVGILASDGTTSPLSELVLRGNGIGLEVERGANISVATSVIDGNRSAGAANLDATRPLPLQGLWWGHPTGPLDASDDRPAGGYFNPEGLGNPVTDGIGYVPIAPTIPLFGLSLAPRDGSVAFQRETTFLLGGPTAAAVRLSEDPSFVGVPFVPMSPALALSLSAGDGTKTVYAQFQAATGNTQVLSTTLRLDETGPTLTVLEPVAGAVLARPTTVRASSADPAGIDRVEFYVDGTLAATDPTAEYGFTWDVRTAGDGPHVLSVVSLDVYGHPTRQDVSVAVALAPPPAPSITAPSDGTVTAEASVVVSGSSEPSVDVSVLVNGSLAARTTASAGGAWSVGAVAIVDGANFIVAVAADTVGSSATSRSVTVTRDNGPPPAPPLLLVAGSGSGTLRFDWNPPPGVADLSFYRLYRSGAPFTSRLQATRVRDRITAIFTTDVPPADGTFHYAVTSVDVAGNESEIGNVVEATVDVTAPRAALACTPTGAAGPGAVALDLTASEPLATEPFLGATPRGGVPTRVTMTTASDPAVWRGTLQVLASMPSGPVTFAYSGRDATGNFGTTLTSTCTLVLDTAGPRATVTVTPKRPLGPGTYPVDVALDEAAAATPALRFVPPVGAALAVPLTGGGPAWQGELVVTAAMGEGTGRFEIDVADAFGNATSGAVPGSEVTLDRTAPFPPSGLAAQSLAGGNVRLSWRPVGTSTFRVFRVPEGQAIDPSQPLAEGLTATTYTDLPAAEGSYSYAVAAADAAGNASAPGAPVTGVSDRTPPLAPADVTLALEGNAIRVTWTPPAGEPADSFTLYRSTQAIASLAGLAPMQTGLREPTALDRPDVDGAFWYAVVAVDAAGNAGPFAGAGPQEFDQAPPRITVTGVADGEVTNRAVVTITYAAEDFSLASLSATLDGAPFDSGGSVEAEKDYVLVVTASDTNGNTSTKTVSFAIDRTAPGVVIEGVEDGALYSTPVTPVVGVTDAHLGTVTMLLNGQPFESGTTIEADGSYTLSVRAADGAGNLAEPAVQFTLDLPPGRVTTLDVELPENGYPVLTWSGPVQSDVVGHVVVRDGRRLTPVAIAATTFTDTGFDPFSSHDYEVIAVDRVGHEGPPLAALLPRTTVRLATDSANPLTRRFLDTLRVEIANEGTTPLGVPVQVEMTLRDGATILATRTTGTTAPVAPGATAAVDAAFAAGDGTSSTRRLDVAVAFANAGGARTRALTTFTLDARDAVAPLEIFNEPLVRGALGKVKVKIYNRGTARMQLRTSLAGGASPDVTVLLKDLDGNILGSGQLDQRTGVNVTSSFAYAEIVPGGSFLTRDVRVQVPAGAPDVLVLEAVVGPPHADLVGTTDVTGGTLRASIRAGSSNPSYLATATTDKLLYVSGETVLVSGQATDTVTGAPAANVPVQIGITSRGFDRYLQATTGADGNFSAPFEPIRGEAGSYSAWATHPAVTERLAQAAFDVVALSVSPGGANLRMSQGTTYTIPIELKNPGEIPLTGIVYAVETGRGVTATIDASSAPTRLEPGQKGRLSLAIVAAADADLANFARLTITAEQGATRAFDASLQLFPAAPSLRSEPSYTEVSVANGAVKTRTVRLTNLGYAPLQDVVVEPPELPWVTLGLEPVPSSIAVGGVLDLPLVVAPPAGLAPGYYATRIVIRSANHVPYVQNIYVTVTSSTSGLARFEVRNTENVPVLGAQVWIQNVDVTSFTATRTTDESGIANFEALPTGRYQYRVQASGTEADSGRFEVAADAVTPVTVFLSVVYVSLEWNVRPVVIEDRYEATLTATFRTNVPAPVLVANPASFDLKIPRDSIYRTQFTLKNHGLVALDDVGIRASAGTGATLRVLVDGVDRLGPNESIVVPVLIWLGAEPEPPAGGLELPAPAAPSDGGEIDPCTPIPARVDTFGLSICLAGFGTRTTLPISFTMRTEESESLASRLGFCSPCDLCEVLDCVGFDEAADICKCLKSVASGDTDICQCAAAAGFGELESLCACTDDLSGVDLCGCIEEAGYERAADMCNCASAFKDDEFDSDSVLACMSAAGGLAAQAAGQISNALNVIGKLTGAFKCGVAIGKCLCQYIPSLCEGGDGEDNPPLSGCIGCGGGGGGGSLGPPGAPVAQQSCEDAP